MEQMEFKVLMEQLVSIRKEVYEYQERIQKIQREIQEMSVDGFVVTDSVTCGRKGKKPLRTVKITGFPQSYYNQRIALLKKRILLQAKKEQELLEKIMEAEEEIKEINDSRIRRILTLRYIDDLSWVQVANRIGGKATADSCRNALDRFFGKR